MWRGGFTFIDDNLLVLASRVGDSSLLAPELQSYLMECYDPSITMEITDDGITIPKFLETGVEVVGDREIICWHSTKVADPNRQIKFRGHHWSRSDAPDYEKTGVLVGTLCRIVANCSDPIYITRPALLTAHE